MSKRRMFSAVVFSIALIVMYAFIILPLNHFSNGSEFFIRPYRLETSGGAQVVHRMYGFLDASDFGFAGAATRLGKDPKAEKTAVIGGFPIAMALFTDGVIIDEVTHVETAFGRTTPAAQLKKGDFIVGVNGIKVGSSRDLEELVENPPLNQSVEIKILRGGSEMSVGVCPAIEEFSNKSRLGLVIRDYVLGVGMVSYVNDDGTFASLGHPISDSLAGKVPIRGGIVYDCEQVGLNKGEKGLPGELKVRIDASHTPIGTIYKCTGSGVYGRLSIAPNSVKYPIANRRLVKMGSALIYVKLGEKAEFYSIDIIRAVNQSEYSDKGLIIRITDPRLLGLTGGIIQGMSGSPIIQNDRIIGAVTHVFVGDPTKGYGIYMDWMHE